MLGSLCDLPVLETFPIMLKPCRLPASARFAGATRAAFVAARPTVARTPARGFADEAAKPAPAGKPYEKITLGVPMETFSGEKRVATTPKVVEKLTKLGMRCFIEKGAGEGANISDAQYKAAGAEIQSAEEVFKKDMIFKASSHPELTLASLSFQNGS